MNEHLPILESAISDVGTWAWWSAELPGTFQVEFTGTQLWGPPSREGKPPSGQIALRFRKPRLVYFLTFSQSAPKDWPDRLQRDEVGPFSIDRDAFTLTSKPVCGDLVARGSLAKALVGEPGNTPLPAAGDAFLGLGAGPVGLVVAAASLAVISHQGELDEQAVLMSNRKWWDYWREYWQRKDTADPMPQDYACEVTIPLKGSGGRYP